MTLRRPPHRFRRVRPKRRQQLARMRGLHPVPLRKMPARMRAVHGVCQVVGNGGQPRVIWAPWPMRRTR